MLKEIMDNLRSKRPLIHNITNYVTVNDCANILLACGGSPIMADDKDEVEEITSICNGLNINIGTLNKNTIEAMIIAGKKSNETGHTTLLDPVGAGASSLRTNTALRLLREIKFDVVRGNISEIKTLASGSGKTSGVDACDSDMVGKDNLDANIKFVKNFAKALGCVVAVTGKIDIISDGEKTYCVYNGEGMMSSVTGTGCMLSAMTTAFVAANPDKKVEAVLASICAMGLCGEIAHSRLNDMDGNSSYRNYIIDAVYNLTGEQLEKGAKYEVR